MSKTSRGRVPRFQGGYRPYSVFLGGDQSIFSIFRGLESNPRFFEMVQKSKIGLECNLEGRVNRIFADFWWGSLFCSANLGWVMVLAGIFPSKIF